VPELRFDARVRVNGAVWSSRGDQAASLLDALEGRAVLARAKGARRSGRRLPDRQGASAPRQAHRLTADLRTDALSGDRVRRWVGLPRGIGGHGGDDPRGQARGETWPRSILTSGEHGGPRIEIRRLRQRRNCGLTPEESQAARTTPPWQWPLTDRPSDSHRPLRLACLSAGRPSAMIAGRARALG
jgi:hypothetical protein